MFYSVFPTKDSTIYDVVYDGRILSNSNAGMSEIVEILHLTESISTYGNSRILMTFDLTEISSSIVLGNIPTSSVEFRLRLKNATHADTVPYGFSLEVAPLSRSYLEGRGLSNFDEGLKDRNKPVNWSKATLTDSWTQAGGDYYSASTLTASQYFETGHENLDLNISNIVYAWLTGNLTNNGLIIKFPAELESHTEDLYVKKFYSRNVHAPERTPNLAVLWQKTVLDDRQNMHYGISGTLVYYRLINGAAAPTGGQMFVNILLSGNTVAQTLTASNIGSGMYQASGVLLNFTASTTGSSGYRDVWFSSSSQYFTGTFGLTFATGSQYFEYDDLQVGLPNLKTYRPGEKILVRVFARNKDYRPAIVSWANQNPRPVFLADAYYQILNAETEEVIVDFSTGTLKYSKLSYDENGNYFELWTSAFKPDYVYKIRILSIYNGQSFVFDDGYLFKIDNA